MKLLRVTAQGLPLFKEKLDLSFYALLCFLDQEPGTYAQPTGSNSCNPAISPVG